MKKIPALFLSLSMIFALSACGNQNSTNNAADTPSDNESAEAPSETLTVPDTEEAAPDTEESETDTESPAGKTLVVYYSASGNTEEAANYIAAATGADLFELVPVDPYSDDNLDWTDDNSRVVYEYDNLDARDVALVESTVSDWESYDTVFVGYPNMEQGFESVLCA